MQREDPDLDVGPVMEHPLVVEALAVGESTADLAGVLRELHRLGEWTMGGHDDWMVDDGETGPVWEVVCSVRLRSDPDGMILASGPHALAAAARCLLKALRHVQRTVEQGLEEGLTDLLGD